MKKALNRWLPVLIWMGVIFYFSSRPDLPSNKIDWVDFIFKKSAHVGEYAIFTFLLFRALRRPFPDAAFLIALFYAFTDETHQFFTPGRGAKLTDVLIDSLGITLMSYYLFKMRHAKKVRH